MAALGYPDCTPEDRESLFTLPAFLDAIEDQQLGYEVWKQKPATLRDAVTEALRIEVWQETRKEKDRDEQMRCERRHDEWSRDNDRGGEYRAAAVIESLHDSNAEIVAEMKRLREENACGRESICQA